MALVLVAVLVPDGRPRLRLLPPLLPDHLAQHLALHQLRPPGGLCGPVRPGDAWPRPPGYGAVPPKDSTSKSRKNLLLWVGVVWVD